MMSAFTQDRPSPDLLYTREMAHRTSNVLQSAMAAIHLSRRGGLDHLDGAMERLQGAAQLNAILAFDDGQPVDLAGRLREVMEATGLACGATGAIEVVYQAETLIVAPDAARRMSMVASELLGNCVRHAFPDGQGSILVALRDDGVHTGLLVEDDGRGERWSRVGGQGHGIVDALAASLGGRVCRTRNPSGSSKVGIVVPSLALAACEPAGHG